MLTGVNRLFRLRLRNKPVWRFNEIIDDTLSIKFKATIFEEVNSHKRGTISCSQQDIMFPRGLNAQCSFWPFENTAQNVHVFIFSVTSDKPGLKIKPRLRTECFTTCSLYSTHALFLLVIVAAISVADHSIQRAPSLKMSFWAQNSIALF